VDRGYTYSMRPAPVLSPSRSKIFIFDTHPIQYHSPIFRELYARNPNTKVFLFNEKWVEPRGLKEQGQIPAQNWNLPLLEGFPSEILQTATYGKLATFSRMRKLLVEEQPTAIFLFGYFSWENWALLFLAHTLKIRVLFLGDTSNDGVGKTRSWAKSLLVQLFFANVERFIAVGDKNRRYYLDKGVPEKNIVVGKHCVDGNFFSRDEEAGETIRKAWRKQHGIPADAIVMLFLGRLMDRKRPLDLAAIHGKIKSPNFYTVVAGNGPLEEKLKSAESKTFRLLGFQDQAQARSCYYGADFLIVPSEFETWGLVVNEAFHCGRPALVTTTTDCADDLVVSGETGEVFKAGDTNAAAAIVQTWVEEPKTLKQLGRQAKVKVTREYSVEKFADAVELAAEN